MPEVGPVVGHVVRFPILLGSLPGGFEPPVLVGELPLDVAASVGGGVGGDDVEVPSGRHCDPRLAEGGDVRIGEADEGEFFDRDLDGCLDVGFPAGGGEAGLEDSLGVSVGDGAPSEVRLVVLVGRVRGR